jgi:hypothetical protein
VNGGRSGGRNRRKVVGGWAEVVIQPIHAVMLRDSIELILLGGVRAAHLVRAIHGGAVPEFWGVICSARVRGETMCYTLGWERDKCEVNVSVDVHIGLRVGVRIGTAAIWRNRFRVENPTIENPSVENPSVGNPVVENFAPAGAFDVGCGGTWASSGAEVDRRERGRAV